MEYHSLLPQGKDDQSALQRIQKLSKNQLAELAPHLLEWVQDGNWPIAPAIGQLLVGQISVVEEDILTVFKSRDDTWKYWIISLIIGLAPPAFITPALKSELKRIAYSPNIGEVEEGVDEAALYVVNTFGE